MTNKTPQVFNTQLGHGLELEGRAEVLKEYHFLYYHAATFDSGLQEMLPSLILTCQRPDTTVPVIALIAVTAPADNASLGLHLVCASLALGRPRMLWKLNGIPQIVAPVSAQYACPTVFSAMDRARWGAIAAASGSLATAVAEKDSRVEQLADLVMSMFSSCPCQWKLPQQPKWRTRLGAAVQARAGVTLPLSVGLRQVLEGLTPCPCRSDHAKSCVCPLEADSPLAMPTRSSVASQTDVTCKSTSALESEPSCYSHSETSEVDGLANDLANQLSRVVTQYRRRRQLKKCLNDFLELITDLVS